MPTYTYECPKGHTFVEFRPMIDRAQTTCGICGQVAEQTIAFAPAVHGFKLGYFEHIERDPVYVGSKQELRELCNKNDCYAPGIMD